MCISLCVWMNWRVCVFIGETDATDTLNLRLGRNTQSLGSAIGFGSGSEEENYTRSRRMRCNKRNIRRDNIFATARGRSSFFLHMHPWRRSRSKVPSATNIVGRALLAHQGECHVQASLRVSPRQVSHSVSARAHAKDMTVWRSHPTGFVLGSAKVIDQALCGIG